MRYNEGKIYAHHVFLINKLDNYNTKLKNNFLRIHSAINCKFLEYVAQ